MQQTALPAAQVERTVDALVDTVITSLERGDKVTKMCIRDRCMLLLGKAHVGEVQVSLWDDDTREACRKAGVRLL